MKEILFSIETNTRRSPAIAELMLYAKQPLPPLHCGQFIHLKPDGDAGLRRPFCLYKFTGNSITIIMSVVGKGTQRLSMLSAGSMVSGVLPLGNGFVLNNENCSNVALIGGGIGCAPLLSVPQCYPRRNYRAYLGFAAQQDDVFSHDFAAIMPTLISTNDGSAGFAGHVTDLFERDMTNFQPDIILACGPVSMLRALAVIAERIHIPVQASIEQRMGCGVGACLVCVCAVRDAYTAAPRMQRVCADGPVFDLCKIIW
jgi:dihydroorotate dehydrogenase electron transfer subunit